MEHCKPKAISRKLDPVKQASFIKAYHALMNQLSADEAVIFADAVHPTHAVRPVGCWAPKEVPVAVEQSSGRDRLNIHGAVDLETGPTIMKDVLTVESPQPRLARGFAGFSQSRGIPCYVRRRRRANVAVARRLAVVLHRMWVDGTEFRWSNGTTAVVLQAA
jgi:hypothetical protein